MAEYTILEAAHLLGITKNQAKYRLKAIPEDEIRHSEDGRIFLSAEGVEQLRAISNKTGSKPIQNHCGGSSTSSEPDSTVSDSNKTSSKPDEPDETGLKPAEESPGSSSGVVAALQAAVDLLGRQLAEKDRQIAEKDKQIQEAQAQAAELNRQIGAITQALQTAQEQAQAAQALHAGTIRKQLLDSAGGGPEPPEAPIQEQPSRRKWWKWWEA